MPTGFAHLDADGKPDLSRSIDLAVTGRMAYIFSLGALMGWQHDFSVDKFFLLVVEFRFLVVLAEQPFAALVSGPGNSRLPSHAPPRYADRATLWNAVEAIENQWNSQLARRIVLAFPVEVPKEQYLSMIKEFCQEQFVSKGMIADFAIHDKGDGNPHAHILLTLLTK